MPRRAVIARNRNRGTSSDVVVFVEGARDREILAGWAQARSPRLAAALRETAVILGGRRPVRAERHMADLHEQNPSARGLCVLDRDGESEPVAGIAQKGLDLFTWSRRHIESYLLVPAAIGRALRIQPGDGRVVRSLREHLPTECDERALRTLDAKRLLAPGGVLARDLGRTLPLARIARATRKTELHEDVSALLDRLEALLAPPAPTVVTLRESRGEPVS